MDTWTALSDPAWLMRLGEPSIMVRVGESCVGADCALADDPEALRKTLVEVLAHDVSDADLGALVRTILEPVRLAGIGAPWAWSRRVQFVRPRESEFLGGEL